MRSFCRAYWRAPTRLSELKNKGEHEMKPSDIMKMDWLVDNVVGSIPPMSEFIDNAKMVVELKGVEGNKL